MGEDEGTNLSSAGPPSNPVAPTTLPKGSEVTNAECLSSSPAPQANLWRALRELAKAWEACANASLGGEAGFLPSWSAPPFRTHENTVSSPLFHVRARSHRAQLRRAGVDPLPRPERDRHQPRRNHSHQNHRRGHPVESR